MKKTLLSLAAAILAVSQSANALTIGADRLLGIIEPGTPANPANAQAMVNGLLSGWLLVPGFNDGAPSGLVLGNNPTDPQTEVYTLKFSASTLLPAVGFAPLATSNGGNVETNNPNFNLGAMTFDWVLAKWGQDAAVYYIGDLAAGTNVTLSLGGTGWAPQGHGLSHYTLFNGTPAPPPTSVPDGGTTFALLGGALVGIGVLRHKFRA